MALSFEQAAGIVTVVANDLRCQQVIPMDTALDPSTLAGGLRNLGHMLLGFTPANNAATAGMVCTGIAQVTMDAINDQVCSARRARGNGNSQSGMPRLDYVLHAIAEERAPTVGVHHSATLVKLRDRSAYVFDWHSTLSRWNPLLYPSLEAFRADRGAVLFSRFNKWS